MKPKQAAAAEEIRALFSNELECVSEGEAKLGRYLIFERAIRLAGMNAAAGKSMVAHVVYAIHPDGYWEQVACQNGEWS